MAIEDNHLWRSPPDCYGTQNIAPFMLNAPRPLRDTLRLSLWLTQTVKTMFAVRCEILDRQDHFSAF